MPCSQTANQVLNIKLARLIPCNVLLLLFCKNVTGRELFWSKLIASRSVPERPATVNGPRERVRRRLKLSPSRLNAFTAHIMVRAAGVSSNCVYGWRVFNFGLAIQNKELGAAKLVGAARSACGARAVNQTHCYRKVFLLARTMMQSLLFPRPLRSSSMCVERKKAQVKRARF